jgi:hypothetical protein
MNSHDESSNLKDDKHDFENWQSGRINAISLLNYIHEVDIIILDRDVR